MAGAIDRIKEVLEKGNDNIDLTSLGLTEIPVELLQIKFIKRINLSGNKIEKLPLWFCEFENLEVLDLKDCNLNQLCSQINKLKKLKNLYISRNKFTELPQELSDLDNLRVLFAKNNLIKQIPTWAFNIESFDYDNNPVIDPPLEIYNRGSEAILNYIKEKEKGTKKIYEAKLLIIGEPGAGKTSLMRKIIDEKYTLNPNENSTLGIEIQPYYFKFNDVDFRLNIWDFGGQEIYHATHQFFLTKRSLYILLADNRAENTDFNHWLQTVDLLSENSPLLIMLNEKQNRKRDINISGMRERFTNLRRSFSFNLADDVKKLKILRDTVHLEVQGLSHIGDELPKSWVEIREKLEKKSRNSPFISDVEYFEVCNKIGGYDIKQALLLSEYFHDIGIFLHFQENPILKRLMILKPDWGTQGVYTILDDLEVIERNGFFTKSDIDRLWNNEFYKLMHDELIALMTKFELCYSLEANESTYIVPQLLQRNKPKYKWDFDGNLLLKYEYEFMPKGIITRFIVRMQEYIENQSLVWREGVILNRNNNCRAEIIQTYGKKELFIRVVGRDKRDFLAIIIYNIDKINTTYKNIKVKKLVPCNCKECIVKSIVFYYEYDFLKRLQYKGIKTHRCNISLEEIGVNQLLENIFGILSDKKVRTFISYSSEDLEIKKQFDKHFQSLIKTCKLSVWDQGDINPGDYVKTVRNENLQSSNIFICLITPNYISDRIVLENEVERIILKCQLDKSLLIPIIMQDVFEDELLYSEYSPILFNGKPLYSNKNIDEALVYAMTQIKKSITDYTLKQEVRIDVIDSVDS